MKIVLWRRTVESRRVVDPARAREDNKHNGKERKKLVDEPNSFVSKLHILDISITDKEADQYKIRSSNIDPSIPSKFIKAVANENSRACYDPQRNRCSRHVEAEAD